MDLPHLDENLTCEECGRHGNLDFGECKLCPACYEAWGPAVRSSGG